ncbi:MAG: hypothetical protein ABW220_01160 [Burkholderiaceae bacterium]
MLLLIDGQRREEEVREMAIRAGSPPSCFDELLDMGMISLPRPSRKMVFANSQAMPLTALAGGDSEPPQDQ